MPPRRELTRDEIHELTGIKPDTWSGYVNRGQAPKPTRHVGRTPLWREDVVTDWMKTRPGSGARTDLRPAPKKRSKK